MSSQIALGRVFNHALVLICILVIHLSFLNGPESALNAQQNQMSKDWKRIRTPNFTAVSNAPPRYVRTILEKLEIFHSTLFTEILQRRNLTSDPVLVVFFDDVNSFSRFMPRDEKGKKRGSVGAYFLNGPDIKHIVLPRYENISSLNVIFHEYYHYLVHRNIPDFPLWMSEGFAEFYSTSECDPEKGDNLIGRTIPQHLQRVQMDTPLPLEQILARESAMKIVHGKDSRKISMFYAQSWLLVHYLMLGQNRSYSHQIVGYLNAVKQGMSSEKAFQTAFKVTLDKMEQELNVYKRGLTFPAVRIRKPPESITRDSDSEPITEIEAEYVQGDLLQRVGAYEDAERVLTKILAREPSHVSAKISLAGVRFAQERYGEALDIVRPLIASDPDNFRAHLSFAAASLQTDNYEDALREYKRAAEINQHSVAALVGVSYAALALGRQADGDEAMSRLQTLEPNPRWYDARAYEWFKRGKYSKSIQDVHSYIGQAGHASESAPYAAFLGAICYLRLQQPAEAFKLLKEVSPEISQGSWTAAIMEFMLGNISSEKFIARAKDIYERTEAHTYTGMMALIAGKRDEALNHLRWVKEKGSHNYVEYGMAVAELKRLDADEPKPAAKLIQ